MRKILFLLFFLSLCAFQQPSYGMLPGGVGTPFIGGAFEPKIYTGVALNAATVAGGAFIRSASGPILFADFIGRTITVSDGTKKAVGYVGPAGTGEVLGDEIVDSWTNVSYETLTTTGSTITSAVNTTGTGICYESAAITAGWLLKLEYTLTLNSGGLHNIRFANDTGLNVPAIIYTSVEGVQTAYRCMGNNYTYLGFRGSSTADFAVSGFSLKRVTAPSASGCWVVNSREGAVYSWASVESGLNWNATSFTVTISR
jgi:hypothetical protein